MHFLHLTFLYCMVSLFSGDTALKYPSSSPSKNLESIAGNTTTNSVEPRATNIIFQSKDGGQTWQDISHGLPEFEQPQGFFAGESEIYLRVNDDMYRSKSNLKTPVWEKENALVDKGQNWKQLQDEGLGDIVESDGVLIGTGQNGIKRSTDNGETWDWVISEGGVGIAVERIEGGFAVISYSRKTQCRRIRISLDGGETWKAIDEGLRPSLFISSIKQVDGYLLCGHPDGIFRSSDQGKTWKLLLPSIGNKVFNLHVSGDVIYAIPSPGGC